MSAVLTLSVRCPACHVEIARLESRVLGPAASHEIDSPCVCAYCAARANATQTATEVTR